MFGPPEGGVHPPRRGPDVRWRVTVYVNLKISFSQYEYLAFYLWFSFLTIADFFIHTKIFHQPKNHILAFFFPKKVSVIDP